MNVRTIVRIALVVLLLVVIVGVAYAAVKCPEDNSGAYFTGKTRVSVAGHLMKQYKCNSYGHLFWVR